MNIGNWFLATCMIVVGGFIILHTMICNLTAFVAVGVGAALVIGGFRVTRPPARNGRARRRS